MSYDPGTSGISGANDVALNNPANDDALSYDSALGLWKNSPVTKTRVGLGNVDNTSDANKPISTAAQTALNNRLLWRGAFVASTTYAINDVVTANGAMYRCQTAHTSGGGIAVDGDPTYWERIGTVSATTISSVDDLPLAVPATVTWNGSSWPARSTATSQATRRVFYIGNPGGAGPTDMQTNDIWVQG